MNDLSLLIPFYRNIAMAGRQVMEWTLYPEAIKIICIDDGSPEPLLPILRDFKSILGDRLELYRIDIDTPWNRSGARNLATHVATTDWIVHVDIDHILPADAAEALLKFPVNKNRWYRFPRWRRGMADATRLKDKIPNDCQYGQIHPHVDSYLMRRDFYWDKVGGYNEDFSGCLGGGNLFLARASALQPCEILPAPIRLEVYTRSEIKDASDWSLSRDKAEYIRRRRIVESHGNPKPKNPLRFTWNREL